MKLTGKPTESATLHLHLVSPRHSYINLSVEIQHCPPGFMPDYNSECICDAQSYVGLFHCDLHSFCSHLLPGYWAGIIDNELVTSACPYCDYNNSLPTTSQFRVILSQNYHELDKAICGETRTGTVCGRCRDNYTVHFHSPGFLCKPAEPVGCRLGWLFYVLSELVPVTVVFVIVLVFSTSFTFGVANGFILFCQLLQSLDVDANQYKHPSRHLTNRISTYIWIF